MNTIGTHLIFTRQIYLPLFCWILFRRHKNIFIFSIISGMGQVIQILLHESQGPTYPVWWIPGLLMTWGRKALGHRQSWIDLLRLEYIGFSTWRVSTLCINNGINQGTHLTPVFYCVLNIYCIPAVSWELISLQTCQNWPKPDHDGTNPGNKTPRSGMFTGMSRSMHGLTHLPLDKMVAILADDISKLIFLNEEVRTLIKISLKFVPKGLIDNNQALV